MSQNSNKQAIRRGQPPRKRSTPPIAQHWWKKSHTSSIDLLPTRFTSDLLVFLADLLDQQLLQILEALISLLHLKEHRCLHIRQPNSNGLHLTTSSRFNFSAIAARQKAEILRQRLLFSRRSAWWSCWECGGDTRGRWAPPGNTPPFPQSRPIAARHWVGVSPAGSR